MFKPEQEKKLYTVTSLKSMSQYVVILFHVFTYIGSTVWKYVRCNLNELCMRIICSRDVTQIDKLNLSQ